MTTEQYSIGYDAGYQDGFDAALAEPVKQEPVAWVNTRYKMAFVPPEGFNVYECDAYKSGELKPTFYAAPVSAEAIRAEALEDAVKFLEENGMIAPNGFTAAGIRGLK